MERPRCLVFVPPPLPHTGNTWFLGLWKLCSFSGAHLKAEKRRVEPKVLESCLKWVPKVTPKPLRCLRVDASRHMVFIRLEPR